MCAGETHWAWSAATGFATMGPRVPKQQNTPSPSRISACTVRTSPPCSLPSSIDKPSVSKTAWDASCCVPIDTRLSDPASTSDTPSCKGRLSHFTSLEDTKVAGMGCTLLKRQSGPFAVSPLPSTCMTVPPSATADIGSTLSTTGFMANMIWDPESESDLAFNVRPMLANPGRDWNVLQKTVRRSAEISRSSNVMSATKHASWGMASIGWSRRSWKVWPPSTEAVSGVVEVTFTSRAYVMAEVTSCRAAWSSWL